MESVGTIFGDGGEWSSSSFNGVFSSSEEADFMAQLLGNCSLPNEISSISNLCLPSPVYSSRDSQGSSSHYNGGASFFPTISSHLHHYYYNDYPILTRNDSSVSSLSCYMMETDHVNKNSTHSMELLMEAETGDEYLNPDLSNDDDSMEESARDLLLMPNPHDDHEEKIPILEDQEDSLSGTSKKRPRIPIDNVSMSKHFLN